MLKFLRSHVFIFREFREGFIDRDLPARVAPKVSLAGLATRVFCLQEFTLFYLMYVRFNRG